VPRRDPAVVRHVAPYSYSESESLLPVATLLFSGVVHLLAMPVTCRLSIIEVVLCCLTVPSHCHPLPVCRCLRHSSTAGHGCHRISITPTPNSTSTPPPSTIAPRCGGALVTASRRPPLYRASPPPPSIVAL
jgi:hypothetical protein